MNKYDKTGIILLFFGFLIPFFVYFGFIIGFPIFIVGVITLLFGNLKIKQKLLWILIPAVSFYPVMKVYSSISFYYADRQKVDLILPANFIGSAIIIGNVDFGQTFEKKYRREQIIFDENGIIFYPTKFKLQSSLFRVFTKQKNGKLKQILWKSKNSDEVTILAYGHSSFEKSVKYEYIPYDFVRIGKNFKEQNQNNSEKRCELIKLIKKGELKTVYNKMYKQ